MTNVRAFQTTPRIVIGPGSLEQVDDEVKRLGCRKVMIITDPGLVQTGIVDRTESLLSDAGLSLSHFDGV